MWTKQADLEAKVKDYFRTCDQEEKPYGIYGLADFLSCHPQSLYDYENGLMDTETEKFSDTFQKARAKIVAYAESRIYDKTAGAVFQLVNLTRKFPEPAKNAQHQEITGKDGGAVEIKLSKYDEGL